MSESANYGNFKNAPMGFNKGEVNLHITGLMKKIEQLEKSLDKAPSSMGSVAGAEKPGAVHEFTVLNNELADAKRKNAELEAKIAKLQEGKPLPPPSAVDNSAAIASLKDGKRKLDKFYSQLSEIYNTTISALSGDSPAPVSHSAGMASTSAVTASNALSSFGDFTIDSSLLADMGVAVAPKAQKESSPKDGRNNELSAFADFTLDSPIDNTANADDDLSAFADFTLDGGVGELVADIAGASGSATEEFARKNDNLSYDSLDAALKGTLSASSSHAPPKAAAVDDAFSEFANFAPDSAPANNSDSDDLSAFGDFMIDTAGSGGDDLSAFADFTIDGVGGGGFSAAGMDDDFASLMVETSDGGAGSSTFDDDFSFNFNGGDV
jgi:hypothetical protein